MRYMVFIESVIMQKGKYCVNSENFTLLVLWVILVSGLPLTYEWLTHLNKWYWNLLSFIPSFSYSVFKSSRSYNFTSKTYFKFIHFLPFSFTTTTVTCQPLVNFWCIRNTPKLGSLKHQAFIISSQLCVLHRWVYWCGLTQLRLDDFKWPYLHTWGHTWGGWDGWDDWNLCPHGPASAMMLVWDLIHSTVKDVQGQNCKTPTGQLFFVLFCFSPSLCCITKASHQAKPRFKDWRNRLYFWWEEKWIHVARLCIKGWEQFVAILQSTTVHKVKPLLFFTWILAINTVSTSAFLQVSIYQSVCSLKIYIKTCHFFF